MFENFSSRVQSLKDHFFEMIELKMEICECLIQCIKDDLQIQLEFI